jgi:hypothetical protein
MIKEIRVCVEEFAMSASIISRRSSAAKVERDAFEVISDG